MLNKIGETLLGLIIPGILTLLTSFAIAYFFNSNSIVTIGDSTKISSNQYINPINLSAFKEINKLKINVPSKLSENQIKSNAPIKIKLIDNNIGTEYGSVFEIEKIPSNSNVELMVMTNKKINDKDIVINPDKNNINVNYGSDVINPVTGQIKSIITNSIIYALILGGVTYWSDRRRDKRIQLIKEDTERRIEFSDKNVKEAKTDIKKTLEQTDLLKKELETFKNDSKKKQILLIAKLNDYRKELNFWRDTIRKVIYQLPNGKREAEQLIKSISQSLKTYQTHEKSDYDFETLKILSKIIKDENDDKI